MPVSVKTDSGKTEPVSAGSISTAAVLDGLAVYVHWPFCLQKCPYCDFNSHVRAGVDHSRWATALEQELSHFRDLTGPRRVTSIFFGGGTPSLMAPDTTRRVIEKVSALWSLDAQAEITLEANPTSVEADRFRDFRAAGVNRVSIGVQALDDETLRFLGRGHSADEARAAVDLARNTFDRMSFDLIYARPDQTVAAWRAELEDAIAMAADHLSLYQLTIEPGTAFAGLYDKGRLTMPDDDRALALFEATQDICAGAGLPAYEISNHARPGAESRHNLTYWRYGDYVGAGPGAHGRLNVAGSKGESVPTAFEQAKKPEAWLKTVEGCGSGTLTKTILDQEDRAAEMIMMGLRLTAGLNEASFEQRIGAPVDRFIDLAALADLIDLDLVERVAGALKATDRGRTVLNSLIGRLIG
jgi:oxygen-independent coproporphyrinogen-3 oxidase